MKNIFLKLNIKEACPAKLQRSRGFAVLFTVLISSVVLAIAIGISSISYQEVALSSLAREGATSFYAADTGAECALYWDIDQDIYNTGAQGACGLHEDQVIFDAPFYIQLNNNNHCAKVTIFKDDPTLTKIESLGYNVSCDVVQANLGGPRMVERALRVTYGTDAGGGGGGGSCNFDYICDAGEDATSCVSDCGV